MDQSLSRVHTLGECHNTRVCVLTDWVPHAGDARDMDCKRAANEAWSGRSFYRRLLCLNREYACQQGYNFIVASEPSLDLTVASVQRGVLPPTERQVAESGRPAERSC